MSVELPGYNKWIFEVITKLKINPVDGEQLFRDPNWFACYDDGMTPDEAIAEATEKGVIEEMKIRGIDVAGHFIMYCKSCNKVISQCRCPDPNKKKIYAICQDCEDKGVTMEKQEITAGEKLLVEHFRGMNGSFYTAFFDAALKADNTNLEKMGAGFPEEIEAVKKYKFEPGYWENLQVRYDNSL